MKRTPSLFLVITLLVGLVACSPTRQQKSFSSGATISQLEDSLAGGHLGICIYDPVANRYLVQYNDRKYFTPASNMKLFTCYAAMKYLGDSLVGMRYSDQESFYLILPSGDPTFLHPTFPSQPVFDFLVKDTSKGIVWGNHTFLTTAFAKGWAWEDYSESFMPERSPFPIHGNFITIKDTANTFPKISINRAAYAGAYQKGYKIEREFYEGVFTAWEADKKFVAKDIPFRTAPSSVNWFLKNLLLKKSVYDYSPFFKDISVYKTIYSQPTDSLLKPMMHRSDNFFAEQTLLMVSNEQLGYMSDDKIIDTLLKTDLKEIPDQPVWVDGSGLSRYNLVTPRDFVWLLNKMKNEFPFERIKNILPTGGEGTLLHYYNSDSGFIYAKTGTLGGQMAISGYLITNVGKTLIFSVLVSNHNGSASAIRRQVESYLSNVRKMY